MKKRSTFVSALAVLAASASAFALPEHAHAAPAEARLSQNEMRVGEPAELVVSVEGDDPTAPRVPDVPGLEIAPIGQMRRMTITNGVVESATDYQFIVVPMRSGTFIIPPITVAGERTEALQLRARNGAAPSPGAMSPGAMSRGAPSSRNAQPGEGRARGAGSRAFVRVLAAPTTAVVGETIPVRVKAYFRPGTSATITAPPTFEDDTLLVDGFRDAVQSEETRRGERFATLTWSGTVTPASPGERELAISLPAELSWREIIEGDPMMEDPFADFFGPDDPFAAFFGRSGGSPFDRFVGSMGASLGPERRARVTLEHSDRLTVRPPPEEGRPADFTGAIGAFELDSEIDAPQVALGEPLTLTVRVAGEGTFDRVELPMLEPTRAYRTYAPSSELVTTGSSGREGTKIFRQAIVPTVAGELEIPALSVSWFDPARGEYVTGHTEPHRVTVLPGAEGVALAPDLSEVTPSDGLASGRADPRPPVATLLPVPHTRWLFAIPALVMALALLAPMAARRGLDSWRDHAAPRRTSRAIRAHLASAERAASAGDARRFFLDARAALQQRLALAWGVSPDALTLADVESRLTAVPADVTAIFERADALEYAGGALPAEDLRLWSERVRAALLELEALATENAR